MAGDKWEIYQDNKNDWRWRRKASNGNIVGASTQGYANEADCVANAEHYGYNGKFNNAGTWEFYEDSAKEWRWRHTAANGNIIGAASEGYTKKPDCVANAERHGYAEKA